MPTQGMPKVKIQFESMGLTAIQRSERGIALLLLTETEIQGTGSYRFTSVADAVTVEDEFSPEVFKYIQYRSPQSRVET